MPGRGPAPKDPERRARRNADPIPPTRLLFIRGEQPELPKRFRAETDGDGGVERAEVVWPEATVAWWKMWAESAISEQFTDSDWSFLLDTAVIHAEFWEGDTKLGAELRQRVAKFGVTPEDRARLRIQYMAADEAEKKGGGPTPAKGSVQPKPKNDPRNVLRLVN